MPRGQRISVEDKIAAVDAKIEKVSAQLAALKDERKKLEATQKEADLKELVDLMKEKGLSAADIKARIQ